MSISNRFKQQVLGLNNTVNNGRLKWWRLLNIVRLFCIKLPTLLAVFHCLGIGVAVPSNCTKELSPHVKMHIVFMHNWCSCFYYPFKSWFISLILSIFLCIFACIQDSLYMLYLVSWHMQLGVYSVNCDNRGTLLWFIHEVALRKTWLLKDWFLMQAASRYGPAGKWLDHEDSAFING
jgi:hypothetical protein